MISQYVIPPGENVPNAKCDEGEDGTNIARVDSNVWSRLIDKLCEGKSSLSTPFTETMKVSDLGLDYYEGWEFEFDLTTTDTDKGCSAYQCADVFGKFKSCSYDSHTSYKTGELKLDCGTAKYAMHGPEDKPKTPLTMHDGICYGPDQFGPHEAIQPDSVEVLSLWLCRGNNPKYVEAGKPETFLGLYSNEKAPYFFQIYWKDGCELENGATKLDIRNPLSEKPDYDRCPSIMQDNFLRCNNGGVGGSVQAGCLVYDFNAGHP
ncbi:hypothetical protein PG984_008892 [Apiospora sp. TS-2023a]